MTVTLGSWCIPFTITIICFVYALFIYDDSVRGVCSGLGNIFMLIPAALISMMAWMMYALCK